MRYKDPPMLICYAMFMMNDSIVSQRFEKSEGKFWGATAAPIQTSFN